MLVVGVLNRRVEESRSPIDFLARFQRTIEDYSAGSANIKVFRDGNLPERYSRDIYTKKCELVYQHVCGAYYGGGRSLYA